MKRLTMLLIPFLTMGALTVAAHADNPAAKVEGKGIATMEATKKDKVFRAFKKGDLFVDNDFKIKGKVNADGSASGTATFVFGEEFSNLWGADVVTLTCEIDTGTVNEDGTVVLQGLSFEEDFAYGIVIFQEITPFEIIVDPAGWFTLRWCALPVFDLEITNGQLTVK